jgi:AMMECR1 domain-containing protein
MDNNILITNVMYYSLFHKKLIDNINYSELPSNAFGIFSTIRRSQKLNSWPTDIHGCIGYWDSNFNTLNKQKLYDNMIRVANDSMWNDERRTYFNPIETDPNTLLELDFMMNPIYKIDKTNGQIIDLNKNFTNKTFGIIIQSTKTNQRATYLPNVFPNISWEKLLESIKQKSGITNNYFEVYAYKIQQIKSTFLSILTNNLYTDISIYKFCRFLLDHIKPKLENPFIYSCNKNILTWNQDDDVRNIATLGEVFKYIHLYPNIANKSETNKLTKYVLHKLDNMDKYSSQSLSFLGYVYPMLKLNNTQFCKKLFKDLDNAEEEFEKPELTIGLNTAGCNTKNIPIFTFNKNESIFKMNWTIQAIISFNKKPSQTLINLLIDKINNQGLNLETNYLAVAFEALCFTYSSTKNSKILYLAFKLWYELEKRKDCYNIFYTFLDGSARVDITGHVNNGLVKMNSK